MEIEAVDLEPRPYAYLTHVGPYPQIGATFGRMAAIAGPAGLIGGPDALFIGLYRDDPSVTPPEALRSDAGIILSPGATVPDSLERGTLPGGRYAKGIHKGSYATMTDSWMALFQAMRERGLGFRAAFPFELYVSDMDTTPEAELVTELYAPVK